ncbi:hypothetical protein AOLI_G00186870 [Acnodon oligacanthus]
MLTPFSPLPTETCVSRASSYLRLDGALEPELLLSCSGSSSVCRRRSGNRAGTALDPPVSENFARVGFVGVRSVSSARVRLDHPASSTPGPRSRLLWTR